jgi:plasmid maintenance system antidote protein VapI
MANRGTSDPKPAGSGFWLNMQARWDLYHTARAEAAALKRIPKYPSRKTS